jgi:hypothetical protein
MLKKSLLILTALASLTMASLSQAGVTVGSAYDGPQPPPGANLRTTYPDNNRGMHRTNIHQNPDGTWSFRWQKNGG